MIVAKGIEKRYGEPVLRGIDLIVPDGAFLSIMGDSGSGKSTLLGILAGNLRPDAGSVRIGETEITAATEAELAVLRRTALGFVYQSLNLIPTLNAADNILLPLYLNHADLHAGRDALRSLAEKMKISALLSRFPGELSGGEQQRVAIARAMIHRPAVLMLDEPTGSLDSTATRTLMELLQTINREDGVTILQVTHDPKTTAYGTATVHLCDGRIAPS